MTIPGLAGGAVGTKYDWNISYVASEGADDRAVSIPLGRVVGGSTKLNRMVFDRGSKSDYDGWEALGNDGWNYEALLPYFKKVRQNDMGRRDDAKSRRTRNLLVQQLRSQPSTTLNSTLSSTARRVTCKAPTRPSSGRQRVSSILLPQVHD